MSHGSDSQCQQLNVQSGYNGNSISKLQIVI